MNTKQFLEKNLVDSKKESNTVLKKSRKNFQKDINGIMSKTKGEGFKW